MSLFTCINSALAPSVYLISVILLCLTEMVKAKECHYFFENGGVKQFRCKIYEFCCGVHCCRSTAMTFYQMWYFWLMVFLTILFCSGGGWWYRLRNHEYVSRGPQVLPTRVTVYSGPIHAQQYPPMNPPGVIPMQNTAQYQYPPPPPYYGPPPSYDTAVNQPQAPARQG